MSESWGNDKFRIGINMAGAVSAGAYTAGVLDFLMEALEQWQQAKDAYIAYLNNPSTTSAADPVPLHDVSIEAFSGASAGGMCAAIASVMVQHPFDHIKTGNEQNTTNTFYESWVNRIDIRELLTTRDLDASPGKAPTSLLDCTMIDQIAEYAIASPTSVPRPFISSNLTLFLTLSNVRGVPYRLYDDPTPTVEEFVAFYGDRLRFEVLQPGGQATTPLAKPLPLDQPKAPAWTLLKETAKATGAFPIFLAPRILERDIADYQIPLWEPITSTTVLPPSFGNYTRPTWKTLNVDGDVIDNNPFELAHQFLVSNNAHQEGGHNPSKATEANCAVITVAPFPAEDVFQPNYDPNAAAAIGPMMGRLISVLISQSRFSGESLEALTSGISFSRFVVAPSDPASANSSVLQCGFWAPLVDFSSAVFAFTTFCWAAATVRDFSKRILFCLKPIP